MKRLAVIITHPIQYNAPIFKLLSEQNELKLKVFYTFSQRQQDFFDKDFGVNIQWDIPLLDGYNYEFIANTAKNPSLSNYKGIKCPTLISKIEEWKATHILVFGWNYKAHFTAMKYFKGKIPVLFRGDSTLLDYDIQSIKSLVSSIKTKPTFTPLTSYVKFKLRKTFLTYIYRYIDTALYVGTNNKAYFNAHRLKDDQLIFAPHAIDNQRFFDSEKKQYEANAKKWRKELGIKETDKVILFAGKLEDKKNPSLLVSAFDNVSKNKPGLKLIIAGNGPLKEQLKEAAHNNNNILFLPFQNQTTMPLLYRMGDVFCLPSQGPGETWGLAINEALACGIPVIVSDKVGCAIDLVKKETGVIFRNNDKEMLSDLLLNFPELDCSFNADLWSFRTIVKQLTNTINAK